MIHDQHQSTQHVRDRSYFLNRPHIFFDADSTSRAHRFLSSSRVSKEKKKRKLKNRQSKAVHGALHLTEPLVFVCGPIPMISIDVMKRALAGTHAVMRTHVCALMSDSN